MRHKVLKVFFAGVAGGMALNVAMLLTFRLLGFGWNGGGVLLDPAIQSQKLIEVWIVIEPVPLVVSNPALIMAGLILFGFCHAFVYMWLSTAWPQGVWQRGLRLSALIFFLSFLFWEFFTPFNMFGEPLSLTALELLFWAVIALTESFTIAAVFEKL